jgi:hypothetical protein
MTPRPLALKLLITGRFFVAASNLFTPRRVAETFRSPESLGTPAIPFMRMFAIRNAALGVGLVRLGDSPSFVKANILIDSVDAAAFAAARKRGEMNPTASALSIGVALSAVAAGAAALLTAPSSARRLV